MDAGKRFVDVTDPDSGSTFRFYEVEYAVACAMDGARDFSGLAAWSQSELGLEPSKEEIETVVSTLKELGYLAAAGEDVELGHAGKSNLSEPRPVVSAPDVELGHAGSSEPAEAASESVSATPEAQPAPAAGDAPVSVDLSQHLSIDTDDVKEAVRQSRVMSAVTDELDEFDDHDAQTAVGGPALQSKLKDVVDKDDKAGSTPIEIPSESPPKAARTAPAVETAQTSAAKEEASGGAMTFVLVILLIGVLAAGGWFVYTNFIQKPADDASSQTTHEPAPVAKQKVVKKKHLRS